MFPVDILAVCISYCLVDVFSHLRRLQVFTDVDLTPLFSSPNCLTAIATRFSAGGPLEAFGVGWIATVVRYSPYRAPKSVHKENNQCWHNEKIISSDTMIYPHKRWLYAYMDSQASPRQVGGEELWRQMILQISESVRCLSLVLLDPADSPMRYSSSVVVSYTLLYMITGTRFEEEVRTTPASSSEQNL